jgi:hypothetical protein
MCKCNQSNPAKLCNITLSGRVTTEVFFKNNMINVRHPLVPKSRALDKDSSFANTAIPIQNER